MSKFPAGSSEMYCLLQAQRTAVATLADQLSAMHQYLRIPLGVIRVKAIIERSGKVNPLNSAALQTLSSDKNSAMSNNNKPINLIPTTFIHLFVNASVVLIPLWLPYLMASCKPPASC